MAVLLRVVVPVQPQPCRQKTWVVRYANAKTFVPRKLNLTSRCKQIGTAFAVGAAKDDVQTGGSFLQPQLRFAFKKGGGHDEAKRAICDVLVLGHF